MICWTPRWNAWPWNFACIACTLYKYKYFISYEKKRIILLSPLFVSSSSPSGRRLSLLFFCMLCWVQICHTMAIVYIPPFFGDVVLFYSNNKRKSELHARPQKSVMPTIARSKKYALSFIAWLMVITLEALRIWSVSNASCTDFSTANDIIFLVAKPSWCQYTWHRQLCIQTIPWYSHSILSR